MIYVRSQENFCHLSDISAFTVIHMRELGDRIKYVRESLGMNQEDFGKLVGKLRTAVHSWETGKNKPHPGTLRIIAEKSGANFHWLRTGEGKQWDVVPVHSSRHEHRAGSAPATPRPGAVEVSILTWPEGRELEFPSVKKIHLPAEIVNTWTVGTQVRGDAMSPTLKDGDYVGIDEGDREITSGELYLLRTAQDRYLIRRILDESPNGFRLKADNPSHDSVLVPYAQFKKEIQVQGRIAWIFGTRKQHN